MRSRTGVFLALCGLLAGVLNAQPRVTAVVNAASGDYGVAPGSLITVWGEGFGPGASAQSVPLPKNLGSTVVTVNNIDLPLLFVSPNQINAQLPFEVATSAFGPARASLTVTTPAGKSPALDFMVLPASPGVFTESMDGKGQALIFDGGFKPVKLAQPGQTVILYATGLGVTNPAATTGAAGSVAEPMNRAILTPDVFIGERQAQVLYAGLTPWPGVYQVNVAIPNQRLLSDRVYLRTRGWQSNIASVTVAEGDTTGITGSIDALFPVPAESLAPGDRPVTITYSPVLVAGKFSIKVDPFTPVASYDVAAVSEAGSAILQVTPGSSYQFSATVPTAPSRASDFSVAGDITSVEMMAGCCVALPNNVIPMSRVDARELQALRLLPMPNQPSGRSATGIFQGSAPLVPQTAFVIDSNSNAPLSQFAGYANVPFGLRRQKVFPFRLYVNGKLIASKDVTADVMGQ